MDERNFKIDEGSENKRTVDDLNDEENEFKLKVAKRRKLEDLPAEKETGKAAFVSPEKVLGKDKVDIEFKTPEKKVHSQKFSVKDELTPKKERKTAEASSPSGWSISSDLSLNIEGDEEDLISKVEQARRLMSSANSSPDKSCRTPKKVPASISSSNDGLLLSPKTPNKGRRVPLITLASPKTKKN